MVEQKTITIYVRRYPLGESSSHDFQAFEVPAIAGMSVLESLRHIQENVDPSLAFDYSCRIGICRGCALLINGKVEMACSTPAASGMRIEPVNPRLTRRDLISRPSTYPRRMAEALLKPGRTGIPH